MITGAFTVSLDGISTHALNLLVKTDRSIPKVDFPKEFSLSANRKHFSNIEQSQKLLQDIINPYIQKLKERLGLNFSHPGLLMIDVFRGQTITIIRNLLVSNDIYFQQIFKHDKYSSDFRPHS